MSFEQVISVKMNPENSILGRSLSYEDMAKTIADHMIASRSKANPYWLPYTEQKGVTFRDHSLYVDAREIYPESRPGDVVYAEGNIQLEKDYEVWINLIGRVQVFLDGECLFSSWEKAEESARKQEFITLPVKLEANRLHRLVIKAVCGEEDFGFRLNVSPPRCVTLWANFYLVMAKVLLPIAGMTREEGMAISPLYSGAASHQAAYESAYGFETDPVYAYPRVKPEGTEVDFAGMYQEGNVAYAYTVAEEDGFVELKVHSAMKAMVNGESVCTLQAGESGRILLQTGDRLLIKSLRTGRAWGFGVVSSQGIGLPMLATERRKDFSMMYCGPFYGGGLEVKLSPEYAENVLRPFPDGKGGRVFWRFRNAWLRAYQDSSFGGQWYYATMLSYNGIRCCGEAFDVPEYVNYFLENESFLADWSEYAIYDCEKFGYSTIMLSISSVELLDHIGTMGDNLIEAYRLTGDQKYLPLIRRLQWNIRHKVTRFEDGTFKRKPGKTMWADDFYMSGPFLTKLYSQMGDKDSLQDILVQLEGFVKRLYLPKEKIFSHIYFWEKEVKNSIPWGRGNGWIAFSMSEMLLRIPKENPAHEKIRRVFEEFCEGLIALQDDCGLWHQVLNRPESYLETSCTAMFTLAFYRGVRNGWLPDSFRSYADKGLKAILERCVDREGIVYGVCMGSSCSMDPRYYFDLPTIKDDNHGTGVVLMLLCERAKMTEEE